MIKATKITEDECNTTLFLNRPEARDDPYNHCVHVLDVLYPPNELAVLDGIPRSLMIMPMLRVLDDPPFHCVAEYAEALKQFLEVFHLLSPVSLLMTCSHARVWNFCIDKISHIGAVF